MPSNLRPSSSASDPIETPRLLLVTVTTSMLKAEHEDRNRLAALLSATVPATWPPQNWGRAAVRYLAERVDRHPHYQGWCRYILLKQPSGQPVIIGGCGCPEPPQTVEEAEIGYSLLSQFRGHGYTTEALNALVPWIFAHSQVHSVCAQTSPRFATSIAVLRRCGFVLDGPGQHPGTVLFRRTRDAAPASSYDVSGKH